MDCLQGDRGSLSFEVKASQKPSDKRGGGNKGSGRSLSGFRDAMEDSKGCYGGVRGCYGGEKVHFLFAGFVISKQNLIFGPKWSRIDMWDHQK